MLIASLHRAEIPCHRLGMADQTMDSESKFGEIEIGGERWRWTTIGRSGGGRAGRVRPAAVRWSVSFRDPRDSDRGFWCELPEQDAARLSDGRLRELFEEARAMGAARISDGATRDAVASERA
jgi:hypothetical protein